MLRSLDEPTVALLRERRGVETDAAVRERHRHRPRDGRSRRIGSRRAPARPSTRCRAGSGSDVRNKLAHSVEKSPDGTFVETDAAVRRPRQRALSSIDNQRSALLGDRNAVLRPQPRLCARADCDRAGHHVRRHGRHQHGARRADDARRLHDLPRADARCRGISTHRSSWPFRRHSPLPRSRAC